MPQAPHLADETASALGVIEVSETGTPLSGLIEVSEAALPATVASAGRAAASSGPSSPPDQTVAEPQPAPREWISDEKVLRSRVVIAGEPFELELENDTIYLKHSRWSLVGSGGSILDAERDLIRETEELAGAMLYEPVRSMSYDAIRLRDFLLRTVSPAYAKRQS